MQQRAHTPLQPDVPSAKARLDRLAASAIGLDLELPVAGGGRARRIYLDSTASTLRLGLVQDVLDRFQPYYANTHSTVHTAARISTEAYRWAHEAVLEFVGADPERYTAFFVGSGTTGGMNRVAATLAGKLPGRDVVITSIMEHHSNDLPHRRHYATVVHVPPECGETSMGCVDVKAIARELEKYRGRIAYVAVTGVSNVTGIINPIAEIARLAHAHGALMVVDGAQMVAHMPVRMSGNPDPAEDIDVLVFSGHKVYAPGSPGVVVTRRELFEGGVPVEVGGGMVDDVWVDRFTPTASLPDREEAGTPNITGAIGLGAALAALHGIGMDLIEAEETALLNAALDRLSANPGLAIYGDRDVTRYPRAGAISFNIAGMHHALTAAILNDYFAIAVRNQCFCAHPYVREMVTEALAAADDGISAAELEALAEMQRGMVRASFGIYTTGRDIDALATALGDIVSNRARYEAAYEQLPSGEFRHRTFRFEPEHHFSAKRTVEAWFRQT
jgi:selenocysteine lyase/cysteine desulfurase